MVVTPGFLKAKGAGGPYIVAWHIGPFRYQQKVISRLLEFGSIGWQFTRESFLVRGGTGGGHMLGGGGAWRLVGEVSFVPGLTWRLARGVSFIPKLTKSFMPLVNSRRGIGDAEREEEA